jgi:hypothetical protein
MKSSAAACFETPWAVGKITLVRKIVIAHDRRPGTAKETMGWNDVLRMEITSNCVGVTVLAIGNSIWQLLLAIQFAKTNSIWRRFDLAIRFGDLIWQFDLAFRFANSIRQFDSAKRIGKTDLLRRFGNSLRRLGVLAIRLGVSAIRFGNFSIWQNEFD